MNSCTWVEKRKTPRPFLAGETWWEPTCEEGEVEYDRASGDYCTFCGKRIEYKEYEYYPDGAAV